MKPTEVVDLEKRQATSVPNTLTLATVNCKVKDSENYTVQMLH